MKTFFDMKGLQYFWPTNDDGVRVDVEQDTTVKKIIKASLGLNRDCAHRMTIYNALRELLSNMIDGT